MKEEVHAFPNDRVLVRRVDAEEKSRFAAGLSPDGRRSQIDRTSL
jgi:hypothetical protein